ncbi:MAG: solute carrier family 26 protein [Balneolaceae bacterium]|nr:solute carrier family 26 protein [Balneolaceae bacterium]
MNPLKHYIKQAFPLAKDLATYSKEKFKGDLSAGLTVGIMLIPQGMAYALIAGLPPQYGLYASVVPLLIYAFLGTSKHLGIGPVALIALLVASAVAPLTETPEEYIALSIVLALMVGVLQLMFGLMRMGFLVNLLSHPVLSGFVSAAAVIIGLSQLHHILGVSSVTGGLHEILYGIAVQLANVQLFTLVTGVAAIALIVFAKKKFPAVPGPVLAVVAGILFIYTTNLNESGVAIVGEISRGLPAFIMPVIEWEAIMQLMPMAVAIALVAFMESIAVAKAVQQKSKEYKIDSNKELIALGAANIGGSLFQSFPTTGSFSRTAINYETGAKTGVAGIISAAVVALTLLFLTPLFYYLPNAVLGAIIIVAVFGLIDYSEFKRLWQIGHYDRYMLLATFAGTLFIGIKEGILLGISLSVIMLLYRSARPNHAVIGKIPGTSVYRSINRYETEEDPNLVVFRFDAPLHFANAEYFREKVNELVTERPDTTCMVLDLNGVNEIDSTGLDELLETMKDLSEKNISVKLAEVKAPVRDMMKSSSKIDSEWTFYMRIEDAVLAFTDSEKSEKETEYTIHLDTK